MRPFRLRRFVRGDGGATATEFALVAIPLLALLFGGIECGRAFWTRQAMQSIVNAGARCMGVGNSACATAGAYSASKTTTFLLDLAGASILPITAADLTLNHNATCAGVSGFSKVSVVYEFQTAVPALIEPLGGGVMLRATACFPNQA